MSEGRGKRIAALAAFLLALALPSAAAAKTRLPFLPPVDFSRIQPSDFADDELDLPYYLAHFATLANAIDDRGPTRGFIRLAVWRSTQAPYNARVMENILALAWFYSEKRPWNQYYGHPALRARLEAALDFWCRSQSPDGRFSEYAPKAWVLSSTAFATKFVGEALLLLRDGPPLDQALYARALTTLRRAVVATLTNVDFYWSGRSYTNQFGNVWGGGLTLLAIRPESSLRTFLESRLRGSRKDFESPAGFYYESDGPDFGYTLNTHGRSTDQAFAYARGTRLESELVERETVWFDWLAWNLAPEPDGRGFFLNRAIETRQERSTVSTYETSLAELVPSARALSESREEHDVRIAHLRGELVATFPRVGQLRIGERSAFSPYVFLNRRVPVWLPSTRERNAARALLPAVVRGSATQQRRDSRVPATFSYVRRPGYYAAFASGKKAATQQRYGLGLFYNRAYGAALQSQTGSNEAAWGTRADKARATYESSDLEVTFEQAKKELPEPEPGIHDLPNGPLLVRYELGAAGEKTVTFGERGLDVAITHEGAFSETLPLLVPVGEKLVLSRRRATFQNARAVCSVRFDAAATPHVVETATTQLEKRVTLLTLESRDKLVYSLSCAGR